ncbi:13333_t:CDS:2, partial [Racocetra persica]
VDITSADITGVAIADSEFLFIEAIISTTSEGWLVQSFLSAGLEMLEILELRPSFNLRFFSTYSCI